MNGVLHDIRLKNNVMKKIFQIQFLVILLVNISCSSQKTLNVGQKSETLNVELNTIYENNKYYISLQILVLLI